MEITLNIVDKNGSTFISTKNIKNAPVLPKIGEYIELNQPIKGFEYALVKMIAYSEVDLSPIVFAYLQQD
ncbi:hypothetical protein CIG2463D_1002 [Campylobacter iguaniorum]|nr:hypothetical protein CIG2463D_1002 [Campylobacter iguaniorum]OCR92545.1 hypothetical protein CFT12S02263_05210 [Campylobacter fetus subsp. testudinum]